MGSSNCGAPVISLILCLPLTLSQLSACFLLPLLPCPSVGLLSSTSAFSLAFESVVNCHLVLLDYP